MRIWFEKGKQKELIEREREELNLSWKEFADKLNINFSKLNSFHYEEVLIDDLTFSKLSLRKFYEKFIVHKLIDNWGQVKGGKLSEGTTKQIKIPKKSEKLAEFFGIMLGDGHVQKIGGYKLGTYNISITGHSILDKDYLLTFVKPLGEKLFEIKARVYFLKKSQGLQIIFDSRNLVDFFEKENFKAGDKIKNQSTIPSWIKENPQFLAACLRGLHDTDGCFYRLTNQNSFQIGFTNHDVKLLKDTQIGLKSLGVGVSNIINNRKYVITKKSEIAKFYKLVGFHNSKHLNKIRAYFTAL
jgi:intein/homing endonuclease